MFVSKDLRLKQAAVMLIIAVFLAMVFLDETSVSVVLTTIQKEFVVTNSLSSWVMNAYLLSLSAGILLFARFSDVFGVKKIFALGILIFAIASLVCGTAHSIQMLITGRVLQGIGASMGLATYLLVLNREIPLQYRGKVLGTAAAIGAIFLSAGPLVGGVCSSYLSWRYIFWLNIPLCIFCLALVTKVVHGTRVNYAILKTIDFFGLAVFVAAVVGLILSLMSVPRYGWQNHWVLVLFMIALLCFVVFFVSQKHRLHPLVNINLFANKPYMASVTVLFLTYACSMSLVFWAIWLEQVFGYSAIKTGLLLLPAAVPYMVSSKLAGKMLDRTGPKKPLLIGTVLFAIGFIWIAGTAFYQQYLLLLVGMLLFGTGWGMIRPCGILAAMNGVPMAQKSMASGILNTLRQFGAAFGFALIFMVIMMQYYHGLHQLIQIQHLVVSAHQLSMQLISPTSQFLQVLAAIKLAYSDGFVYGMAVASLMAIINIVLIIKYLAK